MWSNQAGVIYFAPDGLNEEILCIIWIHSFSITQQPKKQASYFCLGLQIFSEHKLLSASAHFLYSLNFADAIEFL